MVLRVVDVLHLLLLLTAFLAGLLIALLLLVSDFQYFHAIEQPGALISVISPLRRTSVVIAFVAGIRMYGEQNWRVKAVCTAGLMCGVFIISIAGK